MKTDFENDINRKWSKAMDRILEVKELIKHQEDSMERIIGFVERRRTLYGRGYTDAAQKYHRTREDDERAEHTLANLKSSLDLLKHELTVLKKYFS